MAAFANLNSDAGLKKLDEHLLTRYYITSHKASKDDIKVYAALSKPPPPQYVNASRWYNHIETLLSISGISCEGSGVADLIMEEAEQEKKAASLKASSEKKESWDSAVIVISPNEAETDMKKLEKDLRSIQMDGLSWGPSKLVPIGYGLELLRIVATVPADDEFDDYLDILVEEHICKLGNFRIDISGVKESDEAVRSIQASGLFWGSSRLCGSMLLGIECTAVGGLIRSGHTVRFEDIVKEEIKGHRYVQSCQTRGLNRIWSGILSEEDSDSNGDLLGEERASSKKKETGKSGLLLVKLSPSNPDIKKLDESIRSIQREGLVWGESKTVDAGYGITYLGNTFTIVGDQASLNTAIEKFRGVIIPLTH
ncbi:unnamed protein product [Microthlaspi erraticum]|uniref:Translation elongation factor EF1B beta/delta subunit guanine nucleotide exchange domain-containing protein n=1 Tax=Microthlaspi erraticum TaxID=1685480 RepID=A0A6D2IFI8_9BRAS|nr:unnamed protein product [Microthlaspi erraticum]